jgi:hypothetical protein
MKIPFFIFYIIFILLDYSYAQNINIDNAYDTNKLKEIVVKSKLKKPLELLNSQYTTGLFSNISTPKMFDLYNNDASNFSGSILDYLQGRIMGVSIQRKIDGFEVYSTSRGLSIQNNKNKINEGFSVNSVKLYIDEQEVTSDYFTFIHPSDVALVKYFPPGTSQISFNNNQGILLVYLKKISK